VSSGESLEEAVADKSERRVELLLGAKVHATDGSVVGRIEELRAERENGYWVVTEYHLGPTALVERLAVRHFGMTFPGRVHGYRVRWDQIDLSDSDHLRLTCPVEQLERIGAPRKPRRHRHAA
jgi:hypothetical protein